MSANHPGIQVKNNVVTVRGGVNGTIQCFATNIAGTASASAILCKWLFMMSSLIHSLKLTTVWFCRV